MIENYIVNKLSLSKDKIYLIENKNNFTYSDSKKSEKKLLSILEKVNDLSSQSDELDLFCDNWTSSYHLSSIRSNLIRPFFKNKNNLSVLEIGCGCGAITRYLGENFKNVISIEGSYNRAVIAKKRCSDLRNVEIISSRFEEIKFKKKFDIVLCVGVLEYFNKYLSHINDPVNYSVNFFKEILKKDGKLFIAIENRLGLKYSSSCREEHTDILFDGLYGYKDKKGPRTFSSYELKNILKKYFKYTQFYYPLPDYKFPTLVLNDKCNYKKFKNIIIDNYNDKFKNPSNQKPIFDEIKILNNYIDEGIFSNFSNSFVLIAQNFNNNNFNNNDLIFFNSTRKSSFKTQTEIYKSNNRYKVTKNKMNHISNSVKYKLDLNSNDWVEGERFDHILNNIYKTNNYKKFILKLSDWLIFTSKFAKNNYLPKNFFDLNFENLIIKDNNFFAIDLEWKTNSKVNFYEYIYRTLILYITKNHKKIYFTNKIHLSLKSRLKYILSELNITFSEETYNKTIESEYDFYSSVNNNFTETYFIFSLMLNFYLFSKNNLLLTNEK
jgi:2-polyprenyl-3-methyl-5-hydroxy-6-metoxy-1,4-benzoquinol methylase